MPDAPCARVDQHGLAGLEPPELEEAVVGRPERHRNGSSVVGAHAVGDLPGEPGRHGPPLGVRAVEPHGHGAIANREPLYVGTHLRHDAGGLVADDVGHLGQVAAEPAERVAALDAHGLDVDQDVARADDGIGDILVAEDVGCTGFVIDGSFHTRS